MKPSRRLLLDVVCYLVGATCVAVAVTVFSSPNDIAPGGVLGVATVIHAVLPQLSIGTLTLCLNLPLLAVAVFKLGRGFTVRTALVTVGLSLLLNVAETVPWLHPYTADPLLAALSAGVLMGFGIGLILWRGATTGGSEIVARLLERKFSHLPIGRLLLLIDGVVVALSVAVFGKLQSGLYAVVLIFVSSRVTDAVVYGRDHGRMLLILTDRERAVTDVILHELGRGVTLLSAKGGYTNATRHAILCALRPSEVHPLRARIRALDPAAFTIVLTTEQTFGNGFMKNENH